MTYSKQPNLFVAAVLLAALGGTASAQDPFTVLEKPPLVGPRTTAYLRHQLDLAWNQDQQRLEALRQVKSESDLIKLQSGLRARLLGAIGGMPDTRTPLRPVVTGKVQADGYVIEKLLFESLPGYRVPALLYLPARAAGRVPAVLVPCGHSTNGKAHYQYVCSRLARLGYAALSWDPVGQGERSQFWDATAGRSRYNLVCGEHAVLGNLAYLAGANLARWEIWDGIRALDYLVSRPEVDAARVSIIGTSGGGFQAAHIAALDERVKVAVPSCYISSLPMRMANRIFEDPDSDPEQDLYGMVSSGIDHAGLLLLVYPRPAFVAAAVKDFFPIEGTRKTFREVRDIYTRFGRTDRIAMAEGFHRHQLSPENLEAAIGFMNRFNGLPPIAGLPKDDKFDDATLRCTRTGQVRLDRAEERSLVDIIRDYAGEKMGRTAPDLAAMYRGAGYSGVADRPLARYTGVLDEASIQWREAGTGASGVLQIARYMLFAGGGVALPALRIRKGPAEPGKTVLWLDTSGKVGAETVSRILPLLDRGFEVLSFDLRGQGEDRMEYLPSSSDAIASRIDESSWSDPLNSVLANYVYNSLLVGRPYFLQMVEDVEIVARFAREALHVGELYVASPPKDVTFAVAAQRCIKGLRLVEGAVPGPLLWQKVVQEGAESWPVAYVLPGGAYVR